MIGPWPRTPPLVSVIVPAYDSARTIARCCAALAAQRTAHPYEVLVVHSGRDDTCARARRACPTARTIQLASRATPPQARNVGVRAARGSLLGFVDSDVYVAPDWIDRAVEAMAAGYDLVCGSIENGNPHSAVARAEQLLMFNEFMPDQPAHPAWFALSGNTLLTRDAWERYGPFVEVRAAEDVVFSRRLIARGGRILFYPALRACHDNRTRLRPFLRNQVLVGLHTTRARRMVAFADSASWTLFLLALPVAPVVKLAKIALHLGRHRPRAAARMLRELPMLALGAAAYALGQLQGASSWAESSAGAAGGTASTPASIAPASGADPAQGR